MSHYSGSGSGVRPGRGTVRTSAARLGEEMEEGCMRGGQESCLVTCISPPPATWGSPAQQAGRSVARGNSRRQHDLTRDNQRYDITESVEH